MDATVEILTARGDAALAEAVASSTASHVMVVDEHDVPVAAAVQAVAERCSAALIVGDELLREGTGVERIYTPVPDRFSAITRPASAGPFIVANATLGTFADEVSAPEGLWWAEVVRRVAAEDAQRVDEVLVERSSPRPAPAPQAIVEWVASIADAGFSARQHRNSVHVMGEGTSASSVSVIIPTVGSVAESGGHSRVLIVDLLQSLIAEKPAELLEVIVVIDRNTPTEVRSAIHDMATRAPFRVRELDDPVREFSFSRKVNQAAAVSTGSALLLLNDDVKPIEPGWLGRMCDLLRIRGVGAVGATLLYGDGSVQHAGIAGVDGMPDHFGNGRRLGAPFAGGLLSADRSALAVTGAVLLSWARTWDRVGGFSNAMPVNFNDVDYCLKVRDSGEDVLVAGSAVLNHFESRSRDGRVAASEIDTIKARWLDCLLDDPYHPGGPAVVSADWVEPRA